MNGYNTIEREYMCEHGYVQTLSCDYDRENLDSPNVHFSTLGRCPHGCHDTKVSTPKIQPIKPPDCFGKYPVNPVQFKCMICNFKDRCSECM